MNGFINPWLVKNLVCPVDRSSLTVHQDRLISQAGREYPIVNGIPIMLVHDLEQTHDAAMRSWQVSTATRELDASPFFIDTLGISAEQKAQLHRLVLNASDVAVDPVISMLIGATSGHAYESVTGCLPRIPIPRLPEEISFPKKGAILDAGCNWGRWSIALGQERAGPLVGIDPSLGALAAALRLAKQRNVNFIGVVGDARFLPFRVEAFVGVISYSVIQHFSRKDAKLAIDEVHRVLEKDGLAAVQMPNRWGIRCLWHQARRGFSDGERFDVRYWGLRQLRELFGVIGRPKFLVDCYFGLGLQATDIDLVTGLARYAIRASEGIKTIIGTRDLSTYFSDSVWVITTKEH